MSRGYGIAVLPREPEDDHCFGIFKLISLINCTAAAWGFAMASAEIGRLNFYGIEGKKQEMPPAATPGGCVCEVGAANPMPAGKSGTAPQFLTNRH